MIRAGLVVILALALALGYVHWNLQIIPAADNLRKGNRLAQVRGLQAVVMADREQG